jgi:hypothetical protein
MMTATSSGTPKPIPMPTPRATALSEIKTNICVIHAVSLTFSEVIKTTDLDLRAQSAAVYCSICYSRPRKG